MILSGKRDTLQWVDHGFAQIRRNVRLVPFSWDFLDD